ncbi:GNAT family N-acetyltransferase [Thalassotalea sediminis]|uniref:GNAT family N-acetyltransferase n=1 Tax=Thalassotalea sediminis TaxID=1759089 RepID=UPI0025746715|nr:GNAT family protein [Thalassotalea sediminis]
MNLTLLKQPILLESEQFIIQSMSQEDWPLFKQLQSDPDLMHFIGPILDPQALAAKFSQRISPWNEDENHWLTLKIVDKDSQENVGSIGFRLIDITQKRVEIGYLLLPKYQGCGIIPHVGALLLNFIFRQLYAHKVVAYCFAENIGSWKVMEKLGMKREAHFCEHSLLHGEWHDELIYGLLAKNSGS